MSGRYDDEMESQDYTCMNAGCMGDRIFSAAPESWFQSKGLNTPTNCPTCREWNREQKDIGPIAAICKWCKHTWGIEASFRIIYHKKMGNWDSYWEENKAQMKCWRCRKYPFRERAFRERIAESRYNKKRRDLNLNENLDAYIRGQGFYSGVQSYKVPDSQLYYRGMRVTGRQAMRHGENELEHIMKKDHEWASTFGSDDPDIVLKAAAKIAASTDAEIMQCRSGNAVIKADARTGMVVILNDRGPQRIRTAYMNSEPEKYIRRKLVEGKWHH